MHRSLRISFKESLIVIVQTELKIYPEVLLLNQRSEHHHTSYKFKARLILLSATEAGPVSGRVESVDVPNISASLAASSASFFSLTKKDTLYLHSTH